MAEVRGEDGSTASVTLEPGLSRERRWVEGKMVRKWCNRFPVLMKDANGFIHRVPYARYQDIEREGKAKIMDAGEPVLIQNQHDQYTFTRAEDAEERERAHKAYIMQPSDKDFLRATKLAMGIDPDGNFKRGHLIQRNGQAVAIEDIGRFDVESIIKSAEDIVKNLKPDARTGLILEKPSDPETFSGKVKASRGRR